MIILILVIVFGIVLLTFIAVRLLMLVNPVRAWNVNDDVTECLHITKGGRFSQPVVKRCHCEHCEAPRIPLVVPGEVVSSPDTIFFDEHDLAAAEAHEERPEFVRTQVLVNGIPAGPDGTVPDDEKRSWWRR